MARAAVGVALRRPPQLPANAAANAGRFKLTDKSRSRWTAWLHPLITAVVVVATANHYSVDVIAGVAVVLIGEILVYLAVRLWRAGRFGRSGAAPPLAC